MNRDQVRERWWEDEDVRALLSLFEPGGPFEQALRTVDPVFLTEQTSDMVTAVQTLVEIKSVREQGEVQATRLLISIVHRCSHRALQHLDQTGFGAVYVENASTIQRIAARHAPEIVQAHARHPLLQDLLHPAEREALIEAVQRGLGTSFFLREETRARRNLFGRVAGLVSSLWNHRLVQSVGGGVAIITANVAAAATLVLDGDWRPDKVIAAMREVCSVPGGLAQIARLFIPRG
jgi:hypothetical protein